ncbi:hypothetical protein JNUCC0626_24790 [Lentzea sp. JNUCC 0626]|uniref:hypothetical protein n=1 Tax=Lentzea sp. JNUCC 0626 TaxID=3367513 RepID=UPI003747E5E8
MPKTSARLLAAVATTAALLATTVPASAAETPQATAVAYALTDHGTTTEALTAENADLTAPHLASGYTDAHVGWDIRMSDEAYSPGLPEQPFVARASESQTEAGASVGGFVSVNDRHPRGVPFVMLKVGNLNAACLAGGPAFTGGAGGPELWVRQDYRQLEKVQDISWTRQIGVLRAHDPISSGLRIQTTVRATPITSVSQLAAYPQFAKYAGRTNTAVIGYEIEVVQAATERYTVLVAAAAAC